MMSYRHLPGPRGMSGDVVIHGYTFMATTPRAGSFIIDWIKMHCNHQCITGSHFLKEPVAFK